HWYDTVAREFPDLPMIAYNVPSRTAVDIAPETVARLRRKHANIVGVKETTKDFEHFSRVLHVAARARSCGQASSCCACRCCPSAGSGSSPPPPTSPRPPPPGCTSCG
ncbi:MAG TPA: dihydrodipicolinate synthase family protein, partial [Trebonia sp.]